MYYCRACRGDGREHSGGPACREPRSAAPRPHDWRFDAALFASFIALMAVAWMAARYVPGAPLNLLARVQALEAGRCTCR